MKQRLVFVPYLTFGQRGRVLQHVHDDGKKLVHPLPHLQTTHLREETQGNQSKLRKSREAEQSQNEEMDVIFEQ